MVVIAGRYLIVPLLAALAACGPSQGPDAQELRNISLGNAIPKTAPRQLVASFADLCLDHPAATAEIAQALRAQDYVEVPRRPPGIGHGSGAMRSFVVDDHRPAIILSADGRACAVAARARTGQTERIRTMIATRYPGAVSIDPARIGRNVAEAWDVGGGRRILVQRPATPGRPTEVILGRIDTR